MRVRLPDWMAGEFLVRRLGPAAAIVRADFLDAFDRHRLIETAAGRGPLPVADEPDLGGGRVPARVVSAAALGEAVLRPYRRGGWMGEVVHTRYFLGNRAFDELILTHRLRGRGAPVPECLAAVQERRLPGYVACLITRRIPGTVPAARILGSVPEGEAAVFMEKIGGSVRRLHEAGGWHADLNANNLLVPVGRGGVPVVVIDLDRGRFYAGGVPRRRAEANLSRLRRSLRKLGLGAALAAWPAFQRGYEAPPEPPPAA